MYGYVCKHCGARLDPGEKCDCEEEKRWLPELYSRVGKNGWKEGHVGGSDASVCVGMNPYKDNIQLWEEKTGLVIPEDISDKSYVKYGTEAEQHIRALFALDFPQYQVLYEENNMFLNSDYPWMHASLDGELIDENGRHGILEIKTTNILQSMQREKWHDRIPDNYYCQILHYLAVTEYEFAVLKARLKSERKGELIIKEKHYFIERNEVEEDIKMLVEAERRFWECVESGHRPDLILPAI